MLFAYHRRSLTTQLLGQFDVHEDAWNERIKHERRLLGQAGTEVVVVSGPDEATIRRTHARYFPGSTVDESIARAFSGRREQLRLPERETSAWRIPIAVLCTSDAAFQPARLAATFDTVAAARSALQACGQQVEYAGVLTSGLIDEDLIVWVCGAATRPSEWRQLLDRPNPLISLGVCLDDVPSSKSNWRSIDPEGQPLDQLARMMRGALSSLSVLCATS